MLNFILELVIYAVVGGLILPPVAKGVAQANLDFKTAFVIVFIVSLLTAITSYILAQMGMDGLIAAIITFLVGAWLYGQKIKSGSGAIGMQKGAIVSILMTILWIIIKFVIAFLAGATA